MCKSFHIFATLFCAIVLRSYVVHSQKAASATKEKEEFKCPTGYGNGNFADPSTCRRFYQCVDGYPYQNNCPSGLYFDDIAKYCTFKNEARCGPLATTPAPITEAPLDLAKKCDPEACSVPYCFCSKDGTIIPGGLEAEDIPQIILLTFDGAVNLNNYEHYKKVFNGKRKNPNGCDIKGTFFIAHEYSNYQQIQSLAHDQHEIATETISLQQGLQDKGYEEWVGEMIGMREILRHFANVSSNDVVGMRAPYLKPGRNAQYKVIEDFGYIYDSSVSVEPQSIPVWPYTLDYKIPHECKSGTCPTRTFPGIWEVPMNAHFIESYEGGHCPYLDQCVLHNHNADEVNEWLQEDFARHYEQNKAPYMMAFKSNWFQIKELEQGLHKFLDWATQLPDVYFVTTTQALQSITDPKPLNHLNNYEPWACQMSEVTRSYQINCIAAFISICSEDIFNRDKRRRRNGSHFIVKCETPYTCQVCNRNFTFQQSYHRHLSYHTNDRPHICSICGRAFKESSTLYNHQRIHSGEKPLECETCGKCFRQRVSYLVHRRIHTGAMPYECVTCDKKFRYKISLRTHKCTGIKETESPHNVNDDDGDTLPNDQQTEPCSEQTLDEFITESCNRLGIVDHNETNQQQQQQQHHSQYTCENTENTNQINQSTAFACDSFNLNDLSFGDGDGETSHTDLANVTPSMNEIFPQTMDILNALYENV